MKRNGFMFAVFAAVSVFAFTGCDVIQDLFGGGEDTVLVKEDPGSGFQLVSAFSNGVDQDGSALDVIRAAGERGDAEVKIRLEPGDEKVQFGQGDFADGVKFKSENSPATIIIDGGDRTVDLTGNPISNGYFITVGSGVTLKLTNITLKGLKDGNDGDTDDNNVALVSVSGGTLIMGNGAKVQNNRNWYKDGYGGGVYVSSNGTFEMKGNAEISYNWSDNGGGGVYFAGSTFSMSDNAKIFGNTANGRSNQKGGGVFVEAGGTFQMEGGEISGNIAGIGGGVYIQKGSDTFSDASIYKTGGIIYGLERGDNLKNYVYGYGYGGAVVFGFNSVVKKRDLTAGTDVNLDSKTNVNWDIE
jgi:hypothetical protein